MPTVKHKDVGYVLHPIDLAINKLLARRGRHHQEDFDRLRVTEPVDLPAMKQEWLAALADAKTFVESRNPKDLGCLYYDPEEQRFVDPTGRAPERAVPHFGRPGGVLPRILEES